MQQGYQRCHFDLGRQRLFLLSGLPSILKGAELQQEYKAQKVDQTPVKIDDQCYKHGT